MGAKEIKSLLTIRLKTKSIFPLKSGYLKLVYFGCYNSSSNESKGGQVITDAFSGSASRLELSTNAIRLVGIEDNK